VRFDQEMPAVGHSVAGIEAKVQQDLFDLRGVRSGGAQIGCQHRLNLDLLAGCALQQCHGLGNDFVNVWIAGSEHLPASIGRAIGA
jgi:hypothetical protein